MHNSKIAVTLVKRHHGAPVLLYFSSRFSGFPGWLAWFSIQILKVLKGKWLKITGFSHSQTTNKLVNEAANDSARVSGQDRKKLPALGTNQIAGFGGFRPLASLKKINSNIACYKFRLLVAILIFISDGHNWLQSLGLFIFRNGTFSMQVKDLFQGCGELHVYVNL